MAFRGYDFYHKKTDGFYDSSYKIKYNLDVDADIKLDFNPVVKVADTMNALVCQNNIGINFKTATPSQQEIIKTFWKDINLQSRKYKIVMDALLKGNIYANIRRNDLDEAFIMDIISPDMVTVKKNGEFIRYAKISSKNEYFDFSKKVYTTDNETKEYYKEQGYEKLIITGKDKVNTDWYNVIPIAEFASNYNINSLLDLTDSVNEKTAWLRNIEMMHGNPLIATDEFMSGGSNVKHNKKYKMIKVSSEKSIKYVEMNGKVAELINTRIKDNINLILNLYPEYNLAEILSGSNVSEITSSIKFAEINAKVNKIRDSFALFLKNINNIALDFMGEPVLDEDDTEIIFEPIFNLNSVSAKANYETMLSNIYSIYKNVGDIKVFNEFRQRMNLPIMTEQEFINFRDNNQAIGEFQL